MKEVNLNGSGWRGLRLALSLALLKGEQTVFPGGVNILTSDPANLPLYDDIKRFLFNANCGMLAESGEEIAFYPETIAPGRYSIETGNYSSITEIQLFIMPSLFSRGSRSVINYKGVTHSHVSFPTVFIKETLLGLLEQCGFYASMNMKRFGYYGSGGGIAESRIYPAEKKVCVDLLTPRTVSLEGVRIFVAKMDMSLAEREKEFVLKNINVTADKVQVMEIRDADGFGNSIQVYMKYGNVNVILSRDMEIYNSAGDLVFDEARYYAALGSLKDEITRFAGTGILPAYIAAEVIPYMVISGSPVPGVFADAWSCSICKQILD
ncbi:MAG TPA: RNA 3'-terminal phosphate cyclase [Spirochaetota bacterium]|nr:RNA 3'-terminal phosphate cyclase [Spirochaetota bacterium]